MGKAAPPLHTGSLGISGDSSSLPHREWGSQAGHSGFQMLLRPFRGSVWYGRKLLGAIVGVAKKAME